ncbi:histidine phosphatase family protein [Planctomycetota bacterium]
MKLNRNKFLWSIVLLAIGTCLLFGLNGCKIATVRLVIHSSDSFVQLGTISIKHHEPEVITVVIVRHAERANDSLTPDGEKRAETLARLLRKKDISAIFSTKTNRAIETVNNTAERLGIPIQYYNYTSTEGIANLIKSEYVGKIVLVVGHSDTVPPIIEALGISSAPPIINEFDNLFIVTIRDDGVASLTHLKYDIHQDL